MSLGWWPWRLGKVTLTFLGRWQWWPFWNLHQAALVAQEGPGERVWDLAVLQRVFSCMNSFNYLGLNVFVALVILVLL